MRKLYWKEVQGLREESEGGAKPHIEKEEKAFCKE